MKVELPEYHLIQRKRKKGVVLYAGIPRNDGTNRYAQMIQLQTEPADLSKKRDRERRDREAHVEILELVKAGKIGHSSGLAAYLDSFWDYENSEYVRSKRAEGRDISPDYIRSNRQLVWKYFLPYMKHRKIESLADLNKKVLLEWRNHLFEHGRLNLPGNVETDDKGNPIEPRTITPVTINKVRQAVHVALEHAEAIDLIPVNPMRSIKRVHETPQKVGFFEIEEVKKLFAHPWGDFRAYAASLLSVSTGLRLGELRGLLWDNVDLEKQYLNVVTNWQDGQGIKPPKWGDVRYGVPFPSKVAEALETLKGMNPHPISSKAFVFFGETAESPIPRQILPRQLKQAMKREGIPERQPTNPDARRTFHSLRHTAGTLLAATAGMDTVQRLLGHTTQAMTENYVHTTDTDRDIILKAQNGLW